MREGDTWRRFGNSLASEIVSDFEFVYAQGQLYAAYLSAQDTVIVKSCKGKVAVRGDVNADGAFSIADLVMLQKWLVQAGEIRDARAGDLCEDGVLNALDFCVMKQAFFAKT